MIPSDVRVRPITGWLHRKIKMVYAKLQSLKSDRPKPGIISWTKLKASFKAPEVEREIRSLKEDISDCHQTFQTFATIRIETGVENVLTTSQQTLLTSQQMQADVAELKLQLVSFTREQRIEITHMRVDVQEQLTTLNLDSSVTGRVGDSTLRFPLRSRTTDYIGSQLDTIAKEVAQLAVQDWSGDIQKVVQPYKFRIGRLHSFRVQPRRRRRALLQETLRLLDDLEEHADAINDHAYALNDLGQYFSSLSMKRETTIAYTWAVDLYRILIKVDPEGFTPYLSDALCNLSGHSSQQGTDLTLIQEAIDIIRPLIDPSTSHDLHCQLAFSLARHATYLSASVGLQEKAQEIIYEALELYKTVIRQDPRVKVDDPVGGTNLQQPANQLVEEKCGGLTLDQSFALTNDFDITGSDAYLHGYRMALHQASQIAVKLGLDGKAKDHLLESVAVGRLLSSAYPETSLEIRLGLSFDKLSTLASVLSTEEALCYLDEALRIFRMVYTYDPSTYTSFVFNSLTRKAVMLRSLDRMDSAHQIFLEVLKLDTQLVDDIHVANALTRVSQSFRDFGRREEAIVLRVRTVEIYCAVQKRIEEAAEHLRLAEDYEYTHQTDKGIAAADIAFQQFRTLAFEKPAEHTFQLAESLSTWINLVSSDFNKIHQILDRVRSTFDYYDSLVRQDTSLFEVYYDIMDHVLDQADDPNIALSVSLDMVGRLRGLAQVHPEVVGTELLQQSLYHGRLLYGFERLEEAADWFRSLGDKYHDLATTDTQIGKWYINIPISLAEVLKDQGEIEQARVVLKRAVETTRDCPDNDDDADFTFLVSLAMSYEADIARYLGDTTLALKLNTEYSSYAGTEDVSLLILHLQRSKLLTINGIHEEARVVAEEATTTLSECNEGDPFQDDAHMFYWPSEFLRTWASTVADMEDLALALDVAKQSVEEAKRVEEVNRDQRYLYNKSESYRGLALWTLGCIQLFLGDRSDALVSLEDAREMWKRRSKVRRLDLRNLGLSLWALGITYCLLGRHDEGTSTHQELKKTINGLKYGEPTLHRIMTVALDQERRRPAWVRFLESVGNDLRCGHLMDILPKSKLQ
ncbi:hypothetical protein CPB83DRAFT_848753 [Crepidotus variabilis]|uniref:TPR-like protein n=1 Tax=Crepidotus variabilis TaxID=179855 RepID=A0A9P6EME1_9AGAR|nr:hypothetical protein CPB83DRAFT_848753 [Crepidotus variabilis]